MLGAQLSMCVLVFLIPKLTVAVGKHALLLLLHILILMLNEAYSQSLRPGNIAVAMATTIVDFP